MKNYDYLVWFFLQFCMDNNYSASSKTTLLNYYKQATTNSWLNQNNTAGRRVKEEEFLTQFGLLNFKKTWQKKKLLCMEKKTTMKKRATKSGLISEWRISQKWKIIQDASTSRKLLFDCFWFWFIIMFLVFRILTQLHVCNKHCQYHHEKLNNSAFPSLVPWEKEEKREKKYEISACS